MTVWSWMIQTREETEWIRKRTGLRNRTKVTSQARTYSACSICVTGFNVEMQQITGRGCWWVTRPSPASSDTFSVNLCWGQVSYTANDWRSERFGLCWFFSNISYCGSRLRSWVYWCRLTDETDNLYVSFTDRVMISVEREREDE